MEFSLCIPTPGHFPRAQASFVYLHGRGGIIPMGSPGSVLGPAGWVMGQGVTLQPSTRTLSPGEREGHLQAGAALASL